MASQTQNSTNGNANIEDWCKTDCKVEKFWYSWTIKNFLLYPTYEGQNLCSSYFPLKSGYKECFSLQLYPIMPERTEYVGAYINGINNLIGTYKFSIVDGKGDKINLVDSGKSREFNNLVRFYLIERGKLMNKASNLLPNGDMNLCCEICIMPTPLRISGIKEITLCNKTTKYSLEEMLKNLFENAIHSDVTLNAGGKAIYAHKAILSSCSPVFSAMFTHQMKENNENTVDITDISYHVMKNAIEFMYTGKVSDLKTMSKDLLPVTEKYGLEQLKEVCVEELASTLSTEKALDVLHLADTCNASNLKSCVTDFIIEHFACIWNTDSWKELQVKAPKMINELYCTLSKRNYSLV